MTVTRIMFGSEQVQVEEEQLAFTGTDLLADCGGILGLFIGFNFNISRISYSNFSNSLTNRLFISFRNNQPNLKVKSFDENFKMADGCSFAGRPARQAVQAAQRRILIR